MRLLAACLWSQLQTKAEVNIPIRQGGGKVEDF